MRDNLIEALHELRERPLALIGIFLGIVLFILVFTTSYSPLHKIIFDGAPKTQVCEGPDCFDGGQPAPGNTQLDTINREIRRQRDLTVKRHLRLQAQRHARTRHERQSAGGGSPGVSPGSSPRQPGNGAPGSSPAPPSQTNPQHNPPPQPPPTRPKPPLVSVPSVTTPSVHTPGVGPVPPHDSPTVTTPAITVPCVDSALTHC